MNATQPELIPYVPAKPIHGYMPLELLPFDSDLYSPPPSKELVDDIRRNGITDPIKVRDVDGRYQVISGRRRIKAARIVGLDRVPVIRLDGGEVDVEAAIVRDHTLRHDNRISELNALQDLIGRGYDEARMVKATGLSRQQIRARLRLFSLHPVLLSSFAAGTLSDSLAQQIVRLSGQAQSRLAALHLDGHKLTATDVRQQRLAAHQEAPIPTLPGMDQVEEVDRGAAEFSQSIEAMVNGDVQRIDPYTMRLTTPGGRTYVVKITPEEG